MSCLFKILLNDAFLKGTVEFNEFRFAFPLDVFQLVTHTHHCNKTHALSLCEHTHTLFANWTKVPFVKN